ncbi:hypothetical protein TcYC6_0038440 [Trypanosoma cruzi]|nr:hypothetical protein TcYC6_0038440 [Trypanosoma cruzi]
MGDGIPRIANTLPRREKATSALRKADWPAFTPRCVKHSLPPRPHGWTFAVVSYEQLSAISRAAAVTAQNNLDKQNGTSRVRRGSSTQSTHIASPGDSLLRDELIQNVEDQNQALRRGFTMLLDARAKNLRPHPAQAGNISAVWRRRTLILWNR